MIILFLLQMKHILGMTLWKDSNRLLELYMEALVYMHRYNENLIPKVRLDYLHRIQTTYEKLLSDINYKLTTDLSMTDKKAAQNRQADLNAKLNEIKEYDEKIAHIANQRISIDLDDGVKENYDKFKDILAKIK